MTSAGLATFTGCAIDRVGVSYRLAATSPGLIGATSAAVRRHPGRAGADRVHRGARQWHGRQPARGAAGGGSPRCRWQPGDGGGAGGHDRADAGCRDARRTTPVHRTATRRCRPAAWPRSRAVGWSRVGAGYTLTATRSGVCAGGLGGVLGGCRGQPAALVIVDGPRGRPGRHRLGRPTGRRASWTPAATRSPEAATVTLALASESDRRDPDVHRRRSARGRRPGRHLRRGASIDRAGTGYALRATSPGLTAASGPAFEVVAGSAARSEFAAARGRDRRRRGVRGAAAGPALRRRRQRGVRAPTTPVTLTIATGTGTAGAIAHLSRRGDAGAAAGGVAAFEGCAIDQAGTGYRLVASGPGLAPGDIGALRSCRRPPPHWRSRSSSSRSLDYAAALTLRADLLEARRRPAGRVRGVSDGGGLGHDDDHHSGRGRGRVAVASSPRRPPGTGRCSSAAPRSGPGRARHRALTSARWSPSPPGQDRRGGRLPTGGPSSSARP